MKFKHDLKVTVLLKVIGIALLSLYGCKSEQGNNVSTAENIKKPNVLIIYPDQLRRYSAGFWSEPNYKKYSVGLPDPVITPNMDNLAKNGVVFTQAISNFPLCSPARGMLLTGMYPEQNGIWNNCHKDRNDGLRDDVLTITDLFYNAGYNTAFFGKCHWLKTKPLFDANGNYVGTENPPGGHYMNNYDTYIPAGKSRHHIEYFYQSIRDVHYDPFVYSNDPQAIAGKKDGEQHRPKIFSPKNEAEKIINYLNGDNGIREKDKPFFMMWSINPPHNPWTDENTDMGALREHYDRDKFPTIEGLVVRDNADLEVGSYARHYFANVTSVDGYIGEVLAHLRKIGELENTIVVLTSDHGEMMGSHGREGKNYFETESLAVPFIVHWPKKLKQGAICDGLLGSPDILPTVMGLAGLQDSIPSEVEGVDFSDLLGQSPKNTVQKPKGVLVMLEGARGMYNGRYTLCVQEDPHSKNGVKVYIYDNQEDPYQLTKLELSTKPKIGQVLLKLMGRELKRTNDPWYQKMKYNNVIPYEIGL